MTFPFSQDALLPVNRTMRVLANLTDDVQEFVYTSKGVPLIWYEKVLRNGACISMTLL